jgi:hypothetical protein
MLKEKEFKLRFIEEMVKGSSLDTVKDVKYLTKSADENWEVYREEGEGITPEQYAQEEMREWA